MRRGSREEQTEEEEQQRGRGGVRGGATNRTIRKRMQVKMKQS